MPEASKFAKWIGEYHGPEHREMVSATRNNELRDALAIRIASWRPPPGGYPPKPYMEPDMEQIAVWNGPDSFCVDSYFDSTDELRALADRIDRWVAEHP